MDINKLNSQEYLQKVTERLNKKGFRIANNVLYSDLVFSHVAKRTKFEIERGGFCNTSFIFTRFGTPDINTLNDFSTKAFKYALKTSGTHPPRGFLYGILVFPVAIVSSIDENTAEDIRHKEPPKYWAASEKMVLFNLESETLIYCEETFKWGYLYYDLDRIIINEMLSP